MHGDVGLTPRTRMLTRVRGRGGPLSARKMACSVPFPFSTVGVAGALPLRSVYLSFSPVEGMAASTAETSRSHVSPSTLHAIGRSCVSQSEGAEAAPPPSGVGHLYTSGKQGCMLFNLHCPCPFSHYCVSVVLSMSMMKKGEEMITGVLPLENSICTRDPKDLCCLSTSSCDHCRC